MYIADQNASKCPMQTFGKFWVRPIPAVGAKYFSPEFSIFPEFSIILGNSCPKVTVNILRGQAGLSGRVGFVGPDRRMKCRKASSCLQCSVLLPRFPRVGSNNRKNMSPLIPSRSRSSRCTPENTSKSTSGRAFRSVPSCDLAGSVVDPCQVPPFCTGYDDKRRASPRAIHFVRRENLSCLLVTPFSPGLPLLVCPPVLSPSLWSSRPSQCQTNSGLSTAPRDTCFRATSVSVPLSPVWPPLLSTPRRPIQWHLSPQLRLLSRHLYQCPYPYLIRSQGKTRTRIPFRTPIRTQTRTVDPSVTRDRGAFARSAFLPKQEALGC